MFHMVTILSDITTLKLLLKKFGPQVLSLTDYLGKSLLHVACRYDQEEIVKLLLDKDQLDNLFAENWSDFSDEVYVQFVNAKDSLANTASASIHLPHSIYLKYAKFFLENRFFDGNATEGSHGKSVINLVIEDRENEELVELARSKKKNVDVSYQIPGEIREKLDYAFEESWFGESVILNGIGIDDLIRLYCTKGTIKTKGTFEKTIVEFDVQVSNLSDKSRRNELIKVIKYAFVNAYNIENIGFTVIPEWIDLPLLRAINEIIYKDGYNWYEDICELHITLAVEVSIKVTKLSEEIERVTENFEITYEGLLSLLGNDSHDSNDSNEELILSEENGQYAIEIQLEQGEDLISSNDSILLGNSSDNISIS